MTSYFGTFGRSMSLPAVWAKSAHPRWPSSENGSESHLCPSCNGKGKIRKDIAGNTIAPIPHDDDRLKPDNKGKIILASIIVSAALGLLIFFFLYPRQFQIYLKDPKASLIPLKGSLDLSDDKASFMVQPVYVIQNHDFYPIHLRSLTVAVTLSGVQVALSTNSTKLTVPIRGTVVVPDKVRITIGTSLEVYVLFCKDPRDRVHQFFMRLEVTATGETLGGSVTVIYENYSRVFCNYNTGNSGGILR